MKKKTTKTKKLVIKTSVGRLASKATQKQSMKRGKLVVKTKKAAKPKAVKTAKVQLELINLKLTKADLAALRTRAKKYTKGNLSLWLRASGKNYVPRPKDLENATL